MQTTGGVFSRSVPVLGPIMEIILKKSVDQSADDAPCAKPLFVVWCQLAAVLDAPGQRTGVSMAYRTGQCVSGIRRRHAVQIQQVLHHMLDLFLGGMPVADNGLLDLQGGVFMNLKSAVRQRAHGG